jgi:hypothetical protein
MANNFVGETELVSTTSEAVGYPVENLFNPIRSKTFRFAGNYTITASNGTFYFNDGSARTAVVPPGSYTATTLATAIAAAAVTAGATATVVASAYSTAPYVWKLTFNISVTLTLSTSTNAIWGVLGFTGSTDRTGTAFVADAARAHTHEQLTFYFGAPLSPTFVAMIGAIDEAFALSDTAVVSFMMSNINEWTSPPVNVTLSRTDAGIFAFLDSLASTAYEYGAIKIVDRENVAGAGIEIGHLYIGDHETVTTSNVGIGWKRTHTDQSRSQRSLNGTKYVAALPKYREFTGLAIGNIDPSEIEDIEQTIFDVGTSRPFYVSLDPMLEVSTSLEQLTLYAYLKSDGDIVHRIRDIYSIAIDIEEAV